MRTLSSTEPWGPWGHRDGFCEGWGEGKPQAPTCFTLSTVTMACFTQQGPLSHIRGNCDSEKEERGLKSHGSASGLHTRGSLCHMVVGITAPALPSGTFPEAERDGKCAPHLPCPPLPSPPWHLVAMASDQPTPCKCWGHLGILFIGAFPGVSAESLG